MKRARSEIDSAIILLESSLSKKILRKFEIDEDSTFYSGAISHSYYCIFYCAKAMLLTKNIKTGPPNIHVRTFWNFKRYFVDTGLFDSKLLELYRNMALKAEILLELYKEEKNKRGKFTYNTIPQANRSPAEESIKNAKLFFKHCNAYMMNI